MNKIFSPILYILFLVGITACTQTPNTSAQNSSTGTPSIPATKPTLTKATVTKTPVPATATPNLQTLKATAQMAIPQESTFEVIPMEPKELQHWQEYEQALGDTMFARLNFSDVLCEWQPVGREEGKLFLWAVCSGHDPTKHGALNTFGQPVVIFFKEDGSVERVGTAENTPGTWQDVNATLYPLEIRAKFDHVPYTDELFQHLKERRQTPQPPWIVLYATSMP